MAKVRMRSLGLDIGEKRTGVAISDPQGRFALPLTVISHNRQDAALNDIVKLARQYDIEQIIVGLPYSLNGSLGQQAHKVKALARRLSSLAGLDVELWDERLSTVAADRLLTEAGVKKAKKKQHRDAIAAAIVLQGFLDSLDSQPSCEGGLS
ncbi:MAG: Holliday junction resolvase RuvX [Dehalococcoidia bacterium]|nr:Holliday junction resolvase RuvX [Dehalococcoidia bacterium]